MTTTTTRITVPSEMVAHLAEWGPGGTWKNSDGGTWNWVATQHVSKQRWHTWHWLVLMDPSGVLWGVQFGEGATEYQDHQYPWEGAGEVTLRLMDAREVRTIRYEEVL